LRDHADLTASGVDLVLPDAGPVEGYGEGYFTSQIKKEKRMDRKMNEKMEMGELSPQDRKISPGKEKAGFEDSTMIEANKDARTWATICHLSALSTFVGIPLGNILGPLVVWLLKRNDHPFVDDQGKEALNFQISMTIYGIIAGILVILLVGIALLALVAIADFILVIVASMKANDGELYRYPFTIRLIQ
jgi:uncharacterized Tic20 family protein